MSGKKTEVLKDQIITDLKRRLTETEAQLVHVYHFASKSVDKASTDHLAASAVVLTLTALGGREIIPPVAIRGGLSKATIEALKADFVRAYEDATLFKPQGVKP